MISAIVYTSNTGSTEQYARMLAEKTGLPVYSLREAGAALARGTEIAYLGWLMASKVKGYPDAAKRFSVRMVCGVGMGQTGSQLPETRKASAIPEETPLFTLQGGFDLKKLRGLYRMMMGPMSREMAKRVAALKNRTPEEEDTLDLLLHGGSRVSEDKLEQPLAWLQASLQG